MNLSLVPIAYLVAVIAVLAAVGSLTSQVSGALAVLVVIAVGIGMLRLVHTSNPVRRRLFSEQNDRLFFSWCRSGVTGPLRRLYRRLPSDPRCRFCLGPFGGVGRVLRITPSRKNPNFCPG